jgi:hypothetical protein
MQIEVGGKHGKTTTGSAKFCCRKRWSSAAGRKRKRRARVGLAKR